ncbi:hypothetical protein [Methylohalobius crimeensis]|uniref:hypothetical protein n=1 Tax=Methylohalobius crimeensis TaxID=244365 RepID=UPI0003B4A98E|nr:hypothetical protein [Methylohalobius crimeensis]
MTTIKDLQSHQELLEQTRNRIKQTQAAIEENRRIIENAEPDMAELRRLKEAREDVLAAVSLGEATQKQVDSIDKEIQEAEIDIEAQRKAEAPKVARAREAINGLTRVLDAEKKRLDKLEAEAGPLLREYFEAEFDKAGADYIKAGRALADKYLTISRLAAASNELRIGLKVPVVPWPTGLPHFGLPSIRQNALDGAEVGFFDAASVEWHLSGNGADRVIGRLTDSGIDLANFK